MKIIDKLFKKMGYVPYSEYRKKLDMAEEETANWKMRYENFNKDYKYLCDKYERLRSDVAKIQINDKDYRVMKQTMEFYTHFKLIRLTIAVDKEKFLEFINYAMEWNMPVSMAYDKED